MFSYNVKIRKQFSLQFPLSFPFLKKHCTNPLGVVRRSKSSKGGAPEARARYWGMIRMWGCPPRVEGYWNVCTAAMLHRLLDLFRWVSQYSPMQSMGTPRGIRRISSLFKWVAGFHTAMCLPQLLQLWRD